MSDQATFDEAKRSVVRAHESRSSLCEPFLSIVPATGAAVSVLAGAHGQSTMCASDDVAARLDELQFDLGEGPCWEAMSTRRPVLAPGLSAAEHPSWPVFAEALRNDGLGRGVASLFAFPLVVGSLDIGAVDLYTANAAELTPSQVSNALELASITAWQVLRRILADDPAGLGDNDRSPMSRREVHQATGMLLAQLDISASDAALLLQAHAFSTGRPVREVAEDVITRRINLSTDGL